MYAIGLIFPSFISRILAFGMAITLVVEFNLGSFELEVIIHLS